MNTGSYISQIQNLIEWNKIGILNDEFEKNLIIILLNNEEIKATLRINLNFEESSNFIWSLCKPTYLLEKRTLQGVEIQNDDLSNFDNILSIWHRSVASSGLLTTKLKLKKFIKAQYDDKKKGRGSAFKKETQHKVWLVSHGYCMFQGCGEKLNYDQLTGTNANFGYLAHNIASSEQGPRGIRYTSAELSNKPENVLLLCDKHHRLVDKIAAVDYPAEILFQMRKDFVNLSDRLLEALSYEPIPVYSILWPVGGHPMSGPSEKEIAACMALTKQTMKGQLRTLDDNNVLYIKNPDEFNRLLINVINNSANTILQEIHNKNYKAALFAIGPMPALIGLGSLLGNKVEITPMLRHRDSSNWHWPREDIIEPFFEVKGEGGLTNTKDVVICINFTNTSTVLSNKANSLKQDVGADIIEINSSEGFLGSGAIPNPASGRIFSSYMQKLFHNLKSQGKETVHLLVIASNASCVFLGQAIDLHHPKIIVYDFSKEGMIPRLVIRNDGQKNNIELP